MRDKDNKNTTLLYLQTKKKILVLAQIFSLYFQNKEKSRSFWPKGNSLTRYHCLSFRDCRNSHCV